MWSALPAVLPLFGRVEHMRGNAQCYALCHQPKLMNTLKAYETFIKVGERIGVANDLIREQTDSEINHRSAGKIVLIIAEKLLNQCNQTIERALFTLIKN